MYFCLSEALTHTHDSSDSHQTSFHSADQIAQQTHTHTHIHSSLPFLCCSRALTLTPSTGSARVCHSSRSSRHFYFFMVSVCVCHGGSRVRWSVQTQITAPLRRYFQAVCWTHDTVKSIWIIRPNCTSQLLPQCLKHTLVQNISVCCSITVHLHWNPNLLQHVDTPEHRADP